jgi:uncharacterized membrane protein HdeD (DUF308 family)
MNRHNDLLAKGHASDSTSWRRRDGFIMALGISTILAGGAAIIVPRVAGIAADFLIGMILIFDGILQGIYACQLRGRSEFWWRMLGSVLAFIVGVLLVFFPLSSVLTLALLIALFLLISGVFKIILALQLPSCSGRGWILVAGLISIILGLFVFLQLPEGASWVISVVVGVDLIFSGWRLVLAGDSGKAEAVT